MPFNRTNIARNLIGHALFVAGIGLVVWLFWHIDGFLGKYLSEPPGADGIIVHAGHTFLPVRDAVPALWRVVPVALVLVLAGFVIFPKKDIHLSNARVHGRLSFALDDPYHLANLGRLIGGLAIVAMSWGWSDILVRGLAAWIG